MSEERREAEEVREILDVVSDRIPALLKGLRDVMYSKEAAASMADAVATFYKRLTEAGIPKEDALEMARGYMINLRDLLGPKTFAHSIDLDKKEPEGGD